MENEDEDIALETAVDELLDDADETAGTLELATTDVDDDASDDATTDEDDTAEDTLGAAESSPDDDPPQPLNVAPTSTQADRNRLCLPIAIEASKDIRHYLVKYVTSGWC